MSPAPFRVIVIGSGPVGLAAAHALSKAGIDFVILERRPTVVIESGSDLVMLPMALRVLNQLGLYERLEEVSAPLHELQRIDHQGRDLGSSRLVLQLGVNHGYRPTALSRHSLTSVLFESLEPEIQARVMPNKKVTGITSTADGVNVTCADGTSYQGSIVIGADGAHSMTREFLRATAQEAGADDLNDEKPFLTTYRAIWLRFPTTAPLEAGYCAETHGPIATTQLFVGEKTAVIGVYERLDKPTRERVRYTKEDEEAFIQRWKHLPITSTLNLEHAYNNRLEAGLINLEEGVVKHWHHGRMVLVGDAAHKYTPSTGQGCNVGIIDVVTLVNALKRTLEDARASRGAEALPSQEELTSAFAHYQSQRYDIVVAGCDRAGAATANGSWATSFRWFLDRFVISWHFVQNFFANKMAPIISRSPVLDFIAWDDPIQGKVPWASTRGVHLKMQ